MLRTPANYTTPAHLSTAEDTFSEETAGSNKLREISIDLRFVQVVGSDKNMVEADFQIQPSEYYGDKGHLYVNTPYGQGVLLSVKDAFAQVRLRWGGLMSISQEKVSQHASHLNAYRPDRTPSKELKNEAKRGTEYLDSSGESNKRRRED